MNLFGLCKKTHYPSIKISLILSSILIGLNYSASVSSDEIDWGASKGPILGASGASISAAAKATLNTGFGISLSTLQRTARPLSVLLNQLTDVENLVACSADGFSTEDFCYSPPPFSSDQLCVQVTEHTNFIDFAVSFTKFDGEVVTESEIFDLNNSRNGCFADDGVINIYRSRYDGPWKLFEKVVVNNTTKGKGVAVTGTELHSKTLYLEASSDQSLTEENSDHGMVMQLSETYAGYAGYEALTTEEKILARIDTHKLTIGDFYGDDDIDVGVLIDDLSNKAAQNSWQLPFTPLSSEDPENVQLVTSPRSKYESGDYNHSPICISSNFDVGYGVGYLVGERCVATSEHADSDKLYGVDEGWSTTEYMVLTQKNVDVWVPSEGVHKENTAVKALFEDGTLKPICRSVDLGFQRLGFMVRGVCVRSQWDSKHLFKPMIGGGEMEPLGLIKFELLTYKNASLAATTEEQMLKKHNAEGNIESKLNEARSLNLKDGPNSSYWENITAATEGKASYVMLPFIQRDGSTGYAPVCATEDWIGVLSANEEEGCLDFVNHSSNPTPKNFKVLNIPKKQAIWLKPSDTSTVPWSWSADIENDGIDLNTAAVVVPSAAGRALCRDSSSYKVGVISMDFFGLGNLTPDLGSPFCEVRDGATQIIYSTDFQLLTIIYDGFTADKINRVITQKIDSLELNDRHGLCSIAIKTRQVEDFRMDNMHDCADLAKLNRIYFIADMEKDSSQSIWYDMWYVPEKPGVPLDIQSYFNIRESDLVALNPFIYSHFYQLPVTNVVWKSPEGNNYTLYNLPHCRQVDGCQSDIVKWSHIGYVQAIHYGDLVLGESMKFEINWSDGSSESVVYTPDSKYWLESKRWMVKFAQKINAEIDGVCVGLFNDEESGYNECDFVSTTEEQGINAVYLTSSRLDPHTGQPMTGTSTVTKITEGGGNEI